jgi:two-component system sensor kinase FixL
MNDQDSSDGSTLRHQAEARLMTQTEPRSTLNAEHILHELRVHKIELEMQNEELRRAQLVLDAERDRYFDLYNLAPGGYFTLNDNGLILEANLTAVTLFGARKSQLVARPFSSFLSQADRNLYHLFYRHLVSTGQPQVCGDLQAVKRDGTKFWASLQGNRATNTTGATVVNLILSDITIRKQLENARAELKLDHQRNELAHLSRVTILGEMSGSLAHELNQPLTAILSNAQAAQRFLAGETVDLNEVRNSLQDIVADSHRAGEVICRLRLMLQRGAVTYRPLDLTEVVQDTLKLVHNDFLNRGIILQAEFATAPLIINGDRVQLQQVALNLLMNAAEAMANTRSTDKRLCVRTEPTADGGGRVAVEDRGDGLTPKVQANLFHPFFTTKSKGMGLGLKISHTIVVAHGGQLVGANNTGPGATFYCEFPAAKKAPA